MDDSIRLAGIEAIGEAPWGTHFCLFYQSKDDLVDILVPYFKAGLENNEFCMWVTSEPLQVEEARDSLAAAVDNLDDYLARGQIEILDYRDWYLPSGRFEADPVLQAWAEKEKQARERGFAGLRLTGNTFWLEKADWDAFTDYEAAINRVINNGRMMALCTYALSKCGVSEIIDVVDNHQFALVKRAGKWETIESAERRRMEDALRKSNQQLREILTSISDGFFALDDRLVVTHFNPAAEQLLGRKSVDVLGRNLFEAFPEARGSIFEERYTWAAKEKKTTSFETYFGISPYENWYDVRVYPYENGIAVFFQVTTERKRAEELLRRQTQVAAAQEERQRLSRDLHDSVSQSLYGIGLGARTARVLLDQNGRDLRRIGESLDFILSLAEAGLTDMRSLIFDLRPESLESQGLVEALKRRAAFVQNSQSVDVVLELCDEPDVALSVKEGLYSIAREALHNMVKHAQATRVVIRLAQNAESLTLTVGDNGVGFDAGGQFPGHLGLHSMRERATYIDATLEIASRPGDGTEVSVSVPLPQGSPAHAL